MDYQKYQIKEGINLHLIQTNQFKTNLLSIFFTLPLVKENVTKEALISAILRRGSMHYKTSEEISIMLEEMYGAAFDCGIDKIGDNHVLKFYIETINEEYLPQKEEILKQAIELLMDISLNPLIENQSFKQEYVDIEKENLKQIIQAKIDNKDRYALDRCVEEMYKDKPYGLYKYGYIDDLEEITKEDLYQNYHNILKTAKIDIFVSGKVDSSNLKNIVCENQLIKNLSNRKPHSTNNQVLEPIGNPIEVNENMDVTQGKLVMGLALSEQTPEDKYTTLVYNTILGGGVNSKLFQNVREKASLAYTAGSNYVRQKNNIFIRCGIEIQNKQKAQDIILKQLEDMKEGNFSEEDLNNAKTTIISTIDFIPDEQDTQISYYFAQELIGQVVTPEEYKKKIEAITKEQVITIANTVTLHTIYFLTNESKEG